MINKPQGYDEAAAYTGEFSQLPAGLYVCEILGARMENYNGNDRFVMQFDIAEGEHKGFYQERYRTEKLTNQHAKYKGVHRQFVSGNSLPFFKGMMTSIEKSTPGYFFPWGRENNEKTLAGKKFGAVMGRRQFLDQNNEPKFVTEIFQIRSLDGLKDAKIPEDRLLEGQETGKSASPAKDPALANDGFMNIPDGADEELPFM